MLFKRRSEVTSVAGRDAYSFVLAGLARLAASCETLDEATRIAMQEVAERRPEGRKSLLRAFEDYLEDPEEHDVALALVSSRFQLHPVEALAVRVGIAVENDLTIGHLLGHLQQPLAQSRPTIGLLAQAFADTPRQAIHILGQGNAVRVGLMEVCGTELPLPERQIRIPLPTALALENMESAWPGTAPVRADPCEVVLGSSAEERAEACARRLGNSRQAAPALVIRSGDMVEARAASARVCTHLGARALMVHTDQWMGMAPWIALENHVPVFTQWLLPGDRKPLPTIPGYTGPIILLTGPEGVFDGDGRTLLDWRLEVPPTAERLELWSRNIDDPVLAQRLASDHRHAAGRIAGIAARVENERAAQAEAAEPLTYETLRGILRSGDAAGLGSLAELISDEVGDDALVSSDALRTELESVVSRCRIRERFARSLGPSIQTRYRPSVRALFVGPSGTGKTLAVSWLATHLAMPLYRVDLAAVTSKYIGETERNLSQLLARAEQNEVVLLFDEADSLFGKRTDVHEANDRFANAQTNYLLQRMESYDGIAILTSNGRSRFDDAFTRRFDAIVTFPLPGPEERRALWTAHLGRAPLVSSAQLNLLAATAELTGGQIRNAVLRAAVDAAQDRGEIEFCHLLAGVKSEYVKLSRQIPNELKQAQAQPALLG